MKLTNKQMITQMITMAAIATVFVAGFVYAEEEAEVPASATITAPTLDLTTVAPTALDFGGIINGSVAADDSVIRLNSAANVASVPTIAGGGDATLDGSGGSGTITVLSNVDATLDIECDTVWGANRTGATVGVSVLDTFGGDELELLPATVEANTPTSLAVTGGVASLLHVGGLITVKNDTEAGSYEGTITISVDYQ